METRRFAHLLFLILFSASLLGMVSCSGGGRPEPFLDKSQMSALLAEIRISETMLYQDRETRAKNSDSIMRQRAIDVYVPILKKYGVDYQQYQALMLYYMNRPEEMEEILRNTADHLKEMSELADGSEVSETQAQETPAN